MSSQVTHSVPCLKACKLKKQHPPHPPRLCSAGFWIFICTLPFSTGFLFTLALSSPPLLVALEMGDVPLVSVLPENLQCPTRNHQGHLITHLQELLQYWTLWSAVKSRWVIIGKKDGRVSILMKLGRWNGGQTSASQVPSWSLSF